MHNYAKTFQSFKKYMQGSTQDWSNGGHKKGKIDLCGIELQLLACNVTYGNVTDVTIAPV